MYGWSLVIIWFWTIACYRIDSVECTIGWKDF